MGKFEEIRFNYGKDSYVKISKNGNVSYHGSERKKLEAELGPLLNGIIRGGEGVKNTKIDSQKERDLLNKLKAIFSHDGNDSISEEELNWAAGKGDDVYMYYSYSYNGELSDTVMADLFIGSKYNKLAKQDAAALAAAEEEEEDTEDETSFAPEGSMVANTEDDEYGIDIVSAQGINGACAAQHEDKEEEVTAPVVIEAPKVDTAAQAKAEKAAKKVSFSNYIDNVKAGLLRKNTEIINTPSKDETIKKGDGLYKIAYRNLVEEHAGETGYKPSGEEVNQRIALILILNGGSSVSSTKLYAGKTLKVPSFEAVNQAKGGTVDPAEGGTVDPTEGQNVDPPAEGVEEAEEEQGSTELVEESLAKDQKTVRNNAKRLKALRAKENAGKKLTKGEKVEKSNLESNMSEVAYYPNTDADENGINDLGISYDYYGNIVSTGEKDGFEGSTVRGYEDNNVISFTDRYKEALARIEAETDETVKAAKKAEEFKALYKEYAGVKGDEAFAVSVLANSEILQYADKEDIEKAISNNGAEFLNRLADNIGTAQEEIRNDLRKSITERAIPVYTKEKPGYMPNMRFWEIIDNIDITTYDSDSTTNENMKNEKKLMIWESYFKVDVDGEGNKTYTFNPKRRMTYDEAYMFLDPGMPDNMQIAILKTLKTEDWEDDEWGAIAARIFPTSYVRNRIAELVENMSSPEEVINLIENSTARYYLPADKIMEKFGDNIEVTRLLAGYLSDADCKKVLDNYIKTEDGKVTFDKSALPSGVTVEDIVSFLPEITEDGWAKEYFDAVFDAIDFTKYGEGQIGLLDYHIEHRFTTGQKRKLLDGLKKNADLVEARVFQKDMKNYWTDAEINEIYDTVGPKNKIRMIKSGFMSDAIVIVNEGDTFDKILKRYLRQHLELVPRLKKAADKNPEKWTDERINEALNHFCKFNRVKMMKDLGINPTKMQIGDIVDLRNVDWDILQPDWVDWTFIY